MNMDNEGEQNASDAELLARLKQSATRHGYTPGALILAGETMAEFQKIALVPIFGPHPVIDEVTIDNKALAGWPDWVSELVPSGSTWERLRWPDDSVTIRLLGPGGQILAAKKL